MIASRQRIASRLHLLASRALIAYCDRRDLFEWTGTSFTIDHIAHGPLSSPFNDTKRSFGAILEFIVRALSRDFQD
jgi:hypothetical protein